MPYFLKNVMPLLSAIAIVIGASLIGAGTNDAGNPDNDTVFLIGGIALAVAGFAVMTYLTHMFYELNFGFMAGLVLLVVGLLLANASDSLTLEIVGFVALFASIAVTWQTYKRGKDAGKWE